MLVKITRGIGGPKGLLLLVVTVGLGVFLFIGAGLWRNRLLKPKGVIVTTESSERVVALGDKARGPNVQKPFVPGELARVSANAVARSADNKWAALGENSILKVNSSIAAEGETWVTGTVEGGSPITVHGSFLMKYSPVVLNKLVELSEVKLSIVRDGTGRGTSVMGWLRNISDKTISQCLVSCVFQDLRERNIDMRRAIAADLPPGKMVPFQTARSEKAFDSISLQFMYATPEGLRDSLSTVVIQKSSLE